MSTTIAQSKCTNVPPAIRRYPRTCARLPFSRLVSLVLTHTVTLMNPLGQRTLDYLFRDLLPKEGFSPTFDFIRDRSRSVRNDFTMQHETGALAMECHERCARFHILALHMERDRVGFSIAMEEQQLMNSGLFFSLLSETGSNRKVSPTKSQRVL